MSGEPHAFERGALTWVLGIEDTCVYPIDPGRPALDEHVLTGHSEHWRDDLTLLKDLGASAVRYGVSWPLVHVSPEEFDWTVLDEVVGYAVDELGLTIVADLVHYGTPPWLERSFADAGYPSAIEAFSSACAARYLGRISHFTPLNEPVTTASFCGLRGVWPPALTGWSGWVAVGVPIALGLVRSTLAIRAVNPDAVIVHVEASTLIDTGDHELASHARLLRDIGWLPTDLMTGAVDRDHPMHAWLLEHGARAEDLDWLVTNAVEPDVIGVNYYPDLTPRHLEVVDGHMMQVSYDRWTPGLREALKGFADRYHLPLAVTETSIEGPDKIREKWLRDSVAEVNALREEGVDIRGYTWWPLFDFVDWSWAAGGANVEEFAVVKSHADGTTSVGLAPSLGDPTDGKTAFLRRMGVVRLEEQPDGSLTREETSAARAFRQLAAGEER